MRPPPRHAKRRFALALGRICPEKGFHIALDAAKRADFPLLIAGETFRYAAHEAYFAQEVARRGSIGGGGSSGRSAWRASGACSARRAVS